MYLLRFHNELHMLHFSVLDDINSQISGELEKHTDLKAQIRDWDKQMKDQNKNMGGVHQSAQQNVKTQREVKKLENQLENANNKFSHST